MKKFGKKEIVALIIIAVLMLVTVIVGGYFIVDNVNKANSILDNTDATVTEIIEITKESSAEDEGEEVTEATKKSNKNSGDENSETQAETEKKSGNNKSDSKNNNKSDKDSEKTGSTVNNIANNNSDPDAIEEIIPETNADHNSDKVLRVNGVKCYVGDTISITVNMKTPEKLINFQGITDYDDSYLEFVESKGNVNGYFNDYESSIYYNGSDISRGFDFTEGGTLYTATFKVLKKGSTSVENTIEVLSDMDANPIDPADCVITVGVFN